MQQQINLYQPIFAERRKPLSAGILTVALVAAMCAAGAYTVHVRLLTNDLQGEVDTLRVQAQQQPQADDEPEEQIQARIARLEASLAGRRNAFETLQSGAAGDTTGFAARLEALARRHVAGVWIERVVLSGANGSLDLSGAAQNAELVPTYLQRLSLEPALSGARFDSFVIERDAKTTAATPVRFRAGSKELVSVGQQETSS